MHFASQGRLSVRIHSTNILGLGSVRLLQSLLPAFITHPKYFIEKVYLPLNGEISNFTQFEHDTVVTYFKRYLPKSISRSLECTIGGSAFNGDSPLLVLGDMPIKCNSKQTVFVQTPLLVKAGEVGNKLGSIKYFIARWLFKRNIKYVSNFIVQTEAMRISLIKCYPEISSSQIHIILQPAPIWLISSQLKRTNFISNSKPGLRLFYPAATYPHKNHKILGEINGSENWPVSELILTIPNNLNPNPQVDWIKCLGELQPESMVDHYKTVDALLFLSHSESYGLPLVEAMWIGLPIICPNLPYARTLCGEQAIYFEPDNLNSLHEAIEELDNRRNLGWRPDWSANLKKIPRDWQAVADAMLKLATAEEVCN